MNPKEPILTFNLDNFFVEKASPVVDKESIAALANDLAGNNILVGWLLNNWIVSI